MSDRSLVDRDYLRLIERGFIGADRSLVNPASFDVTLGDRLIVESKPPLFTQLLNRLGILDYQAFDINKSYQTIDISYCSKENPYYLYPNQPVLAVVEQFVDLPANYQGVFQLKSSIGRLFVNHCLAGYIDPGYKGCLTLELINHQQHHKQPLWPGMRIGQIRLQEINRPDKSYRCTGHYQGDTTVKGAKLIQ